jgi:hypothetical protein
MAKKKITVSGVDYSTVRAAAKAHGLAHGNVTRRLNTGWTIEQAFELEPRPQRNAPNATKLVTGKGIFNSIRDAANAYGLLESTISNRLRLGWSDKQAVGDEKPPRKRPRKGRTLVCENKEYPSVNDFADAYGVNRIRTRKRLDSGWTPEEAVGLKPSPPRFRNQDGSVRDHAWTAKAVTTHGETVPVSGLGKYTLYLLKDKKTEKEYVGITTGDIKTRLRGHWNLVNKGRQSKLYNRMRKALEEGRHDDFAIEILREDACSFEELQEQEYQEIKKRDTIKHGYNTAEGGSLGTPSPIVVDGKEFISQLAAAEHYGVDPYNFNQRIKKLGWTPEQAAGLDPEKQYGIGIEVGGQQYSSISQACTVLGKNYKKVHARLNNHGWTLEQAFDLKPAPKPKKSSNSIRIVSSIGEFESVGDASKVVGVKHATITSRLRKGWTHDEALGLVKRRKAKL